MAAPKKLSAVSNSFFDPGLQVTPPSAINPISTARASFRRIFISAISAVQRVALAVQRADAPAQDRNAFLEEFIVRRELAINFVRFNRDYENFDACEPWADVTQRKHARDTQDVSLQREAVGRRRNP